ncbi:Bsp6I family type II restriction endonuclease [Candidatus Woesearchaeota archaeon]|nr:Bsp6I family type II restriction endonuclease [Candidatus Woesearchaeota archaeon]
MHIKWEDIDVNHQKIKALITVKEKNDRVILKDLYSEWKNLSNRIRTISTRGINLPEAISENAFCLIAEDYVRVVKLSKGKCSYDCVNIKNGKRAQIKVSSTSSDLSSFGPKSEWDELYFLDFSKGDGSFKVYKIGAEWVYNCHVNNDQTFQQQQKQGRRPRFSIVDKIIKPKDLKPIGIYKL